MLMAMGSLDKIINYRYQMHGTGKAETAMKAVGIAAAAAAAGLAALTISSVHAASGLEEIRSKFEVVFGEYAPRSIEELDQFADSINRSSNRMLGFASTIQDTLVPIGFMRDYAAQTSVEVVKLATDLSSFNDIPTADVINDIQSALVGQYETMRKYGVVLSADIIKELAYNEGIWDGVDAITAQEKAAGALIGIIEGTTDAQGDALRTAGSFTNQLRTLEDAWYDIRVEIGEEVIPIIQELMPDVVELMGDFKEFAVEIIPTTVQALVNLAPALMGTIELLGKLAPLMNTVAWGWEKLTFLLTEDTTALSDMMTVSAEAERATYEQQQRMFEIQRLSDANLMALVNQAALTEGYISDVERGFAESEFFRRFPELNTQIVTTTQAVQELSGEIEDIGSGGGAAGEATKAFGDKIRGYMQVIKEERLGAAEEVAVYEEAMLEKQHMIIREGLENERQNAMQINDLMSSGAMEFGRILANGGKDWEGQMLAAIARMALEFAQMQTTKQMGSLGGGIFGFLGSLI